VSFSSVFEPIENSPYDFRYKITPKKDSSFIQKPYIQVFDIGKGFVPNLSVLDLIFNMGPETIKYM
jgi:hypothetical protein